MVQVRWFRFPGLALVLLLGIAGTRFGSFPAAAVGLPAVDQVPSAAGQCVNGSYATRYGCTSWYVPGGYGIGYGSGYGIGYGYGAGSWAGYGASYVPGYGNPYSYAPGSYASPYGYSEVPMPDHTTPAMPATYTNSGQYCTLSGGEKLWVPTGASPDSMGCSK